MGMRGSRRPALSSEMEVKGSPRLSEGSLSSASRSPGTGHTKWEKLFSHETLFSFSVYESVRKMLKINKRLLPVKAHFFFFMAASGPVLPYLTVYGKQLGISEVLMGGITAAVPITFLLAKPVFGFIADYFYERRKLIFMALIAAMAIFYLALYFIPPVDLRVQRIKAGISGVRFCNESAETENSFEDGLCNASCADGCGIRGVRTGSEFCFRSEGARGDCNGTEVPLECREECLLQLESDGHLFHSFKFYGFVLLMTLSMIAFNVCNSISDAICFDVLGDGGDNDFGHQRVWGTVGFGITALLGGAGMDLWSGDHADVKNYAPAFVLVGVFVCIDLICCLKLKLPKLALSENIIKDLSKVLKNKSISIFLVFATLAGVLDGFLIFFMFWFLEDLAKSTDQLKHIKVLEGLTVAAETLGGEVLFFLIAGKILAKLGFGHTLSLCFFNYALRLGLISFISDPWWILPVELFMQGPTYALCYTTIVAYANAMSPPGTSATMQGIVAGMDDGFGYALGSLAGGFLYRAVGGRLAFRVFSVLAMTCCVAHMIVYKNFLSKSYDISPSNEYKPPGEAYRMVQRKADASSADSHSHGINQRRRD